MRGLFGPEAGPPGDAERRRKLNKYARKVDLTNGKGSSSSSSSKDAAGIGATILKLSAQTTAAATSTTGTSTSAQIAPLPTGTVNSPEEKAAAGHEGMGSEGGGGGDNNDDDRNTANGSNEPTSSSSSSSPASLLSSSPSMLSTLSSSTCCVSLSRETTTTASSLTETPDITEETEETEPGAVVRQAHSNDEAVKATTAARNNPTTDDTTTAVATSNTEANVQGMLPDNRNHNAVRRWETPEEARERLRFRLEMVNRRLDLAVVVTAMGAAAAGGSPRRLSPSTEPWVVAAGKVARAAGVGTMHGKALGAGETLSGGSPGVTWCVQRLFALAFCL